MPLESALGGMALEETQHARFGAVSLGTPVIITNTLATTLADPAPGKRVRLKWISVVRGQGADETANEFTLRWQSGASIYTWPIGYIPAFQHSVVREGNVDQNLEIIQTLNERLIINLDWEQID